MLAFVHINPNILLIMKDSTNNLDHSKTSLIESGMLEDPVTLEYFDTPVVAPDGWTYNLPTLVTWLKTGNKFFPKTRQDFLGDITLYPNFSLAQSMVDNGILEKMPFIPGETYRFHINNSIDSNKKTLSTQKVAFSMYSLVDISLNALSIYNTLNYLNDNENDPFANAGLASSLLGLTLSALTLLKMITTNSPYTVRKFEAANVALGFFSTIANCVALTSNYSTNITMSLIDLTNLSPIAKTIYYSGHLLKEMCDKNFFSPKPQTNKKNAIELV